MAIGKLEYLRAIPDRLQLWSGEISWEKYCISKRIAQYCQDYIELPTCGRNYLDELLRTRTPKFKVDHISLRLLSDRRKISPNSFEEPDPVPGKLGKVSEQLDWMRASNDFRIKITLLARLGMPNFFHSTYLKDPTSWISLRYGGRNLPYLDGVETLWPQSFRYLVVNSGTTQGQAVLSSSYSARTRGLIIEPEERGLELAKDLGLSVRSTEAIMEEFQNDFSLNLHGSNSLKSSWRYVNDKYLTLQSVDILGKKVRAHEKAFIGPQTLAKAGKSFPARMRVVRRKQNLLYETNEPDEVTVEQLRDVLKGYPQKGALWVEKAEIQSILPSALLPSLDLPVSFLNGSASLRIMPSRVIELIPESTSSYSEEDIGEISGDDTLSVLSVMSDGLTQP
jgi:hypothetical protein